MEPLRLKVVAAIGPGAVSRAEGRGHDSELVALDQYSLFRRVRASLSQKWIVPSEPETFEITLMT